MRTFANTSSYRLNITLTERRLLIDRFCGGSVVRNVCSVHVISKHRLSILLALSRLQRSNTLSNHMLMHSALELES